MLFHKWRIRKLSSKMNHCVKVISEIDEWLKFSDDAVLEEIESLRFSRVKAQAELERLTWKYIELKQKYPHKIPPFPADGAQWDSFNNVKKKLTSRRLQIAGAYRHAEEETLNGIANSISEASGIPADELEFIPIDGGGYRVKQISVDKGSVRESIQKLKNSTSKLHEIIKDDQCLSKKALLNETIKLLRELKETVKAWGPPFNKIAEEKGEGLEEAPNCTTVKDLEAPMRDKMVEEDPGLQGDLAMLLHKLRDPANHPVSLLALAYQVAQGQCPDAKLIALALEMLVDEYRKGIGPVRDFEMSDKACLEALDVERKTTC